MSARAVARLAILVAVATTLQIAESSIPKPLPWLRLGLANGVTLLAVMRIGARGALAVTACRVLLGGLAFGSFGGPSFLLSASGSLGAWAVMAAAWRLFAPPFSVLGVSVLGSAAHVAGQLLALAFAFELGSGVLALAPWLTASAVPLGLVTGAVIRAVHARLPAW
ncbi:MAG: Gx transporter family protein [Candidatus Eiseniibacteriota bacterium]